MLEASSTPGSAMALPSLLRLILLAAIWGSSFLFMRVLSPVMGALSVAAGRVAFASLGLWLLLRWWRLAIPAGPRWRAALWLGVISSAIPFLMYSLAAHALPAGYSAMFNATTPLMAVLVGGLAFGERLAPARLAGLLLGLAGVAVLLQTGPVALTPAVLLGGGMCLLATTCYALSGYLTRRWIGEQGGMDSRLVALGSQLGVTAVLLPLWLLSLRWQPLPFGALDAGHWLAWLALGLLCTAAAYVLYFRLIADEGPLKAMSVTFVIAVFGVLWGVLFLHEALSGAHLAGGVLIALALWLVVRQPAPK